MGGEITVSGKSAYCLASVLLSLTMLCSMMLTVAAQTNNLTSAIGSWQPPKNFVDPVTLKIQEFRSQGLNDEEITAKLSELGMGWYPETGATWMGRVLTPEELAEMPIRAPVKAPLDENAVLSTGRASCMRTNYASWTGVASEVVSGSMSVSSGQTRYHYLCVQLGSLDSGTNWVETVLTHNYGETYKWYTYDSDEGGGLVYYMDKNTPITAADTCVLPGEEQLTRDVCTYMMNMFVSYGYNYCWLYKCVDSAATRSAYGSNAYYAETHYTAATVFTKGHASEYKCNPNGPKHHYLMDLHMA